MCGITGYIGQKKALPLILYGLKTLEYRGYDSAGVALLDENTNYKSSEIVIKKKAGKVDRLIKFLKNFENNSLLGIGHTRWATHGIVSDNNAHPHLSNSKQLALIHNGIMENYIEIKKLLIKEKYTFYSDTDTEVLLNYIEFIQKKTNTDIKTAISQSLKDVKGEYAILLISSKNPKTIFAIRKGSPLAIGKGENEYFIGSDINPFIKYTNKVIYLPENTLASVSDENLELQDFNHRKIIIPKVIKVANNESDLDKGNYDHFTLKEIHEQPTILKNLLRLLLKNKTLNILKNKILSSQRIIILGCGSTLNVALWAKYLIEKFCKLQVHIEQASEFRYRNPVIKNDDIFIFISQSGETADILNSLKLVKKFKVPTISICNVENSSLYRNTDYSILTHAGIEIGVASTKAFTAQMLTIQTLAYFLSDNKELRLNFNEEEIRKVFLLEKQIKKAAYFLSKYKNTFFLGRDLYYPIAKEGALKLKEISYIHAEAYSSSEMKHGPIALVDENFPVVYLASDKNLMEKNISNIREIKSRNGKIIGVTSQYTSQYIKDFIDFNIILPSDNSNILQFHSVITLQMLAYYVSLEKNCDVDKPRNLAKSVTVE